MLQILELIEESFDLYEENFQKENNVTYIQFEFTFNEFFIMWSISMVK
jgi:hypothetical protein